MRKILRWSLTILPVLMAWGHAYAAEPVSSQEIKSLYSGRVVERSSKGAQITVKYFPDGQLEGRVIGGKAKMDQGKWWVPNDGTVCWQWNRWREAQENCYRIERDGDTVYRIEPGGERGDL